MPNNKDIMSIKQQAYDMFKSGSPEEEIDDFISQHGYSVEDISSAPSVAGGQSGNTGFGDDPISYAMDVKRQAYALYLKGVPDSEIERFISSKGLSSAAIKSLPRVSREKQAKGEGMTLSQAIGIMKDPLASMELKRNFPELYEEAKNVIGRNIKKSPNKANPQQSKQPTQSNIMDTNW